MKYEPRPVPYTVTLFWKPDPEHATSNGMNMCVMAFAADVHAYDALDALNLCRHMVGKHCGAMEWGSAVQIQGIKVRPMPFKMIEPEFEREH